MFEARTSVIHPTKIQTFITVRSLYQPPSYRHGLFRLHPHRSCAAYVCCPLLRSRRILGSFLLSLVLENCYVGSWRRDTRSQRCSTFCVCGWHPDGTIDGKVYACSRLIGLIFPKTVPDWVFIPLMVHSTSIGSYFLARSNGAGLISARLDEHSPGDDLNIVESKRDVG